MNRKKTLIVCLLILIGGAAATALIFFTEPEASSSGATKQTAMLVEVTDVEQGTFRPTIEAMGTVKPSQDVMLQPRVSGEIIHRSQAFTPGGYVQKGETLLRIDPSDYQNMLQQRKSELRQARSDLNIEMGRQDVARQDLELLGDTLSRKLTEQNKSLVLREPQLEAAKSSVESARAAVEQAELNMQRTTIRAPFDAHILSRNVTVGSQVAMGDDLGRLVGLDTYWVEATIPQSKLRRITLPNEGAQGSQVQIRNRSAWDPGEHRVGQLHRLVGSLEGETRMARLLIEVPDPRGQQATNEGAPPLIIGSYVEAMIKGEELTNVIRLNRDYIRDDNTVWVMDEGKLRIKNVNIVFRDQQYAYIDRGLNAEDKIVTTNLSTVTGGAPLRLQGPDTSAAAQNTPKAES